MSYSWYKGSYMIKPIISKNELFTQSSIFHCLYFMEVKLIMSFTLILLDFSIK